MIYDDVNVYSHSHGIATSSHFRELLFIPRSSCQKIRYRLIPFPPRTHAHNRILLYRRYLHSGESVRGQERLTLSRNVTPLPFKQMHYSTTIAPLMRIELSVHGHKDADHIQEQYSHPLQSQPHRETEKTQTTFTAHCTNINNLYALTLPECRLSLAFVCQATVSFSQ